MKLVRDGAKLYLITGTVDMRMGIDGYIAVVQNRLHMDVFDNTVFLFCNRDHSKLKMLYWDSTGFWLFYKRLEKGNHFKWIRDEERSNYEGKPVISTEWLSNLSMGEALTLQLRRNLIFKPFFSFHAYFLETVSMDLF